MQKVASFSSIFMLSYIKYIFALFVYVEGKLLKGESYSEKIPDYLAKNWHCERIEGNCLKLRKIVIRNLLVENC